MLLRRQKRKSALLCVLPIAELHAPVQSLRLSCILSHYGAYPLDPHLWAQAEVEQQLDCPMRRYLLKYGAWFSGLDDQDDPVFLVRLKDEDLVEAPDDSASLQSLRFPCARVIGVYPPLALAEAFITEEDSAPRGAKAAPHGCGPAQTQADG